MKLREFIQRATPAMTAMTIKIIKSSLESCKGCPKGKEQLGSSACLLCAHQDPADGIGARVKFVKGVSHTRSTVSTVLATTRSFFIHPWARLSAKLTGKPRQPSAIAARRSRDWLRHFAT